MRPTRFSILILLLTSIAASAKDQSDWNRVKRLKPNTGIHIVTRSGDAIDAVLLSASDTELRLDVSAAPTGQLAYSRTIARADIVDLYRVPTKYPKTISGKTLLLSSLAGIAVGIGVGAAVDEAYPSAEDPGQGKLIGGVLGTFLGPVVTAAGRQILNATRRSQLVYRAP